MTTQESMLARHKILHELGRGALGAVYAARDQKTGAVVALKRLHPPSSSKPDASLAARFLKHARSARRLRHRNIVGIHYAGEAVGTAYVAMEMLEGESLRKILDGGPLPLARAIRIAREIASGLAYAHLEGVVHGGIKPSNIIVLRSGAVKITDFGIAQGGVSPEQIRGDPVDYRCDIFALGALLYEMLARRPPFQGGSPKELQDNILHAEPPPPSQLNPLVPRGFDALVSSMLAKQPAARMPGVPVLLGELQRIEEGIGLESGASAGAEAPAASVPPLEPGPKPQPEPALHRDRVIDPEPFDHHRAMMQRGSRPERPSRSRPAILAALALALAVAGIGLAGFEGLPGFIASRLQPAPPPPVAEATREAVTAPAAPRASPARAVVDAKAEQQVEPEPLPQAEAPVADAPVAPALPDAAPAPQPARAMQAAEKAPAHEHASTARLIVAISPRGELYVDGKHHGTTPPVTTFDLAPGMRRIEVRNGSRKPYLTYMTVEAGDVRRIRHDFDAKPSRLPR